jgi:hypothetical protein
MHGLQLIKMWATYVESKRPILVTLLAGYKNREKEASSFCVIRSRSSNLKSDAS